METAKGKTHEEINRLANRIDTFEKYDYPHTRLIAELATRLARRLGLTPQDAHAITEAALLHDIGLQAMTPAYHTTPGLLSYEERMDLWRHAVIGEQQMARRDATRHAQLLVRWHHEWWCGLGYPDMLAYEDIPIGARLLRAVELYCALIGDRPYRAAMNGEQAMETLKAAAGIECDPYVVKALVALIEDIRAQAPPIVAPAETAAAASPLASPYESTTSISVIDSAPAPASLMNTASDAAHAEPSVDSHIHFATHEGRQAAVADTPVESPVELIASAVEPDAPPHGVEPPRGDVTTGDAARTDGLTQAAAPEINDEAALLDADEPLELEPLEGINDAREHSVEHSVEQAGEATLPYDPDQPVSDEERTPAPTPAVASEPVKAARTAVEWLMSGGRLREFSDDQAGKWCGWRSSGYNRKSLLGFEASVLRQVEFRSIAIPFFGWTRLDLYLKAWGKLILANDPRAWAAAVARAMLESRSALGEEQIARVLEDVYVPGVRLTNPELRRWFGETDAWWMDNLRRNVESLEDESCRAQALAVGLMTGDYALSFNDETRELRRPLTTVFWRLAGRALAAPASPSPSRSCNLPAEDFIRQSRADLLYLNLPVAHTAHGGSEARAEWRETWIRGTAAAAADGLERMTSAPQSKHAYLAAVDRLLRAAANLRTWAISYQEIGLTSAAEITELIQEHRPVRATYSKDLTEVAGGLRNYIIVADRAANK